MCACVYFNANIITKHLTLFGRWCFHSPWRVCVVRWISWFNSCSVSLNEFMRIVQKTILLICHRSKFFLIILCFRLKSNSPAQFILRFPWIFLRFIHQMHYISNMLKNIIWNIALEREKIDSSRKILFLIHFTLIPIQFWNKYAISSARIGNNKFRLKSGHTFGCLLTLLTFHFSSSMTLTANSSSQCSSASACFSCGTQSWVYYSCSSKRRRVAKRWKKSFIHKIKQLKGVRYVTEDYM